MIDIIKIPSPIGEIVLGFSDKGLLCLEFGDRFTPTPAMQWMAAPDARAQDVITQLQEYFAKERQVFDVALDLRGTDFQRGVWESLRAIPYGQTWTYTKQADFLGNRKALRAVASANGRNPVAIIVPCHRVIGKDGSLTGFSSGLWRKAFLLELEAGLFV